MKQNTPNDINDERDTERVKYARIIEHKICKTRCKKIDIYQEPKIYLSLTIIAYV